MTDKILVGIDLGTTVLKVCAFDSRNGSMLAKAVRLLPVQQFEDNGKEQKTGALDRLFREAVNELQKQLGMEWQKVAGIGLAAQGGSAIIADRKTGKTLTPMILWNDGRAHSYTAKLAAEHPSHYWRKYTLCGGPPEGLGRLVWLKERKPELFCEKNIHIGAGEYLFFKLTGVWRQDAGNAIQIGSYNAVQKKLFPTLLKIIDVPLSFTAPLRQGHETAPLSPHGSQWMNLPAGIPAAGPYIDQETGYLSARGGSGCPLQCSLGTAWVGNFVLPDSTNGASPTQLVLPSPIDDGRLVIQPLFSGNTVWEWGLDQFVNSYREYALQEVKEIFRVSLLPKDGLLALPWLNQSNPINPELTGAGIFWGLNEQTDRADLLRALVMGMCFELARMFGSLVRSGSIDSIVLGGGASKGVFFRKYIAALFPSIPVRQQLDEDLSAARGSIYAFQSNAACAKTKKVSLPSNKLVLKIQERYKQYLHLFDTLYQSIPAGKAFHFKG